MAGQANSWLARRIQGVVKLGLARAYNNIKVDSTKYLLHLRRAYGLPVESFRQMHSLPLPVVDHIADQTIRVSMKFALAEGAGFGVGGMFTIFPDVGFLSGITFRMIQRLSLLYGFEYSTEEEIAELWIAAASAAGVDIGKELVEKEVIERFVPRVIQRIAIRASTEVAEKWLARLIPVLSSAFGGALNYHFVRAWGRRAKRHFREKHLLVRRQLELARVQQGQLPPAT